MYSFFKMAHSHPLYIEDGGVPFCYSCPSSGLFTLFIQAARPFICCSKWAGVIKKPVEFCASLIMPYLSSDCKAIFPQCFSTMKFLFLLLDLSVRASVGLLYTLSLHVRSRLFVARPCTRQAQLVRKLRKIVSPYCSHIALCVVP